MARSTQFTCIHSVIELERSYWSAVGAASTTIRRANCGWYCEVRDAKCPVIKPSIVTRLLLLLERYKMRKCEKDSTKLVPTLILSDSTTNPNPNSNLTHRRVLHVTRYFSHFRILHPTAAAAVVAVTARCYVHCDVVSWRLPDPPTHIQPSSPPHPSDATGPAAVRSVH